MSQQCGTCVWWDQDNKLIDGDIESSSCLWPEKNMPFYARIGCVTHSHQGQNCATYQERKE